MRHGSAGSRFLSDGDVNSASDVQALVASGDCFVTLATILDRVSDELTADAAKVRPQLEKATKTLLYLQRHYTIERKTSDYRQ